MNPAGGCLIIELTVNQFRPDILGQGVIVGFRVKLFIWQWNISTSFHDRVLSVTVRIFNHLETVSVSFSHFNIRCKGDLPGFFFYKADFISNPVFMEKPFF